MSSEIRTRIVHRRAYQIFYIYLFRHHAFIVPENQLSGATSESPDNIGCAIRIMSAESSEVKYVTFGRGGALDARRAQSTEPLSMDQGVPKFFLSDEVQCKGVLFYDDLKKAAKNGAYLWTRNDEKFHDIKTMAVVPINGWDGRKRSLIGLLYLTSKTNSILNVTHIDSMMFAGDQLALTYSSILAILDSCSLSYKPSSFWGTDKHGNL